MTKSKPEGKWKSTPSVCLKRTGSDRDAHQLVSRLAGHLSQNLHSLQKARPSAQLHNMTTVYACTDLCSVDCRTALQGLSTRWPNASSPGSHMALQERLHEPSPSPRELQSLACKGPPVKLSIRSGVVGELPEGGFHLA